jgi:uncharacterized SAM-binding protein YcdF (DUF218 family)
VRQLTSLVSGSIRALASICAALFALCVTGFVWFAVPPSPENEAAPTDAIVVLTGGSLRVDNGIELLRRGKAHKLFVSGVHHQVDLENLLHGWGGDASWASCCVELGYEADDTLGNARETAQWIRQQGFRSLRLVTAWYHMRRSLLEFDRAMPEIEIVAHPVFPEQVKQEQWWMRRGTALLLINEYGKYLATLFRPFVERLQPAGRDALSRTARDEAEPAKPEIR